MAPVPNYAAVPRLGRASLSVANPNRDGTGTLVSLFTAGTNGSLVKEVTIKAIASTTAGMIRLFLYNGTNYTLHSELTVSAVTPSATAASFAGTINLRDAESEPLELPSGWSLHCSTEKAESFHVICKGADF